MANSEQHLQALYAQRQALRDRLQAIQSDFGRGLDADSGERAVQLENTEVLEAISRSTMQQLEQIEEEIRSLESKPSQR